MVRNATDSLMFHLKTLNITIGSDPFGAKHVFHAMNDKFTIIHLILFIYAFFVVALFCANEIRKGNKKYWFKRI